MRLSASSIACFKSCRREYQLKYLEGLEPVKKADSLQSGEKYHSKLEDLYNKGYFEYTDYTPESAMALAYMKYIYPQFKMRFVEEWFEKEYQVISKDHKFVGRIDGWSEDDCLVEHKTTGMSNLDAFEFDLQWNEQILAYMWATGARKCYFTVCRRPNIKKRKDESDFEFFKRMCSWFDEDTDSKIRLVEIERTDEDIQEFESDLKWITGEIEICHRHKTLADHYGNNIFYRNTKHCRSFSRRCDYSNICLHYDPALDYVGFTKSERRDEEGN